MVMLVNRIERAVKSGATARAACEFVLIILVPVTFEVVRVMSVVVNMQRNLLPTVAPNLMK